jgi:hypothetical protein
LTRDAPGRLAIAALTAFLGLVLVVAIAHPWLHGDSGGVDKGSGGIIRCIEHDRFTRCDSYPYGHQSSEVAGVGFVAGSVDDFPLLQYLPGTAFRLFLSFMATARLLIVLNALALIGTVALSWYTARRIVGGPWPPLLAAALIASPLLWYAIAFFGEALAAFTIVAAVAAVALWARPWIVVPVVAIACTSKETQAPFLFVMCTLVVVLLAPGRAETRRMIVAIIVGCIAGVALNTAFNIFRFGSLVNTPYMASYFRVPKYSISANFFLAMWVSPNGGILWWWPAALGLLLVLAFGGRRTLAGWGFLALLAINFAGLSRWWAPFGWIAWAPRLQLPLVPGLLLAAVVSCGSRAMRTIGAFLKSAWLWVVAAFVFVLAIPQLGVLFSTQSPFGAMFTNDDQCVVPRDILQHPAAHYRCVMHQAWTKKPILLHGFGEAFTPWAAFAIAMFALAFGTLLWCARSRVSDATTEEGGELGGVGRAGRRILLGTEGRDGVLAAELGLQEEARTLE